MELENINILLMFKSSNVYIFFSQFRLVKELTFYKIPLQTKMAFFGYTTMRQLN